MGDGWNSPGKVGYNLEQVPAQRSSKSEPALWLYFSAQNQGWVSTSMTTSSGPWSKSMVCLLIHVLISIFQHAFVYFFGSVCPLFSCQVPNDLMLCKTVSLVTPPLAFQVVACTSRKSCLILQFYGAFLYYKSLATSIWMPQLFLSFPYISSVLFLILSYLNLSFCHSFNQGISYTGKMFILWIRTMANDW